MTNMRNKIFFTALYVNREQGLVTIENNLAAVTQLRKNSFRLCLNNIIIINNNKYNSSIETGTSLIANVSLV